MNLIGRIDQAEKVCKALGLNLKLESIFSNTPVRRATINGYLGQGNPRGWVEFKGEAETFDEALIIASGKAYKAGMADLRNRRADISESAQEVAGKMSALEDL